MRLSALALLTLVLSAASHAETRELQTPAAAARQEYLSSEDASGRRPVVAVDQATGFVRTLRVPAGQIPFAEAASLTPLALSRSTLADHGAMFGVGAIECELELIDARQGRASHHARYRQVVASSEVLEATLALHYSASGVLVAADSSLVDLPHVGSWRVPAEAALASARADFGATDRLRHTSDAVAAVWRVEDGRLLASWRVNSSSREPFASILAIVDATTGEVIDSRNIMVGATGTGQVFQTNPIRDLADPTLTDMGDSCYPQIMAGLSSVVLERLDGLGRLTGNWVDTSPSWTVRAFEPTLDFNYCRDTDFFNEVMCYYHIDRTQEWFRSLGFTTVVDHPQLVDPNNPVHGAFYDPFPKTVLMGNIAIDASEDADVILHEYGHAVHDDQIPGYSYGDWEAGSISEGYGDYLGESMNTPGPGSFQYGEVGDWWASDPMSSVWSSTTGTGLRSTRTFRRYPYTMRFWDVHEDGEIWSAALFDLREQLGQATTDAIVLESHFLWTVRPTMLDAGESLLVADAMLFAGANQAVLTSVLTARGVLVLEDTFEPNDSQAAAAPLPCGLTDALLLAVGNEDWFTFELLSTGGWLRFNFHGPFDVTQWDTNLMQVWDPIGTPVFVAHPTTIPADGVVDLVGAMPGTYTIQIRSGTAARLAYTLSTMQASDGAGAPPPLCGDCNADGMLSVLDAFAAAADTVGVAPAPNPIACEVNLDGDINVIDALILALASLGLPPGVTCGSSAPCGQGGATEILCGSVVMGNLTTGTGITSLFFPQPFLSYPDTADFYNLRDIPPGTSSITITLTGTGELDLLASAPGVVPGSFLLWHYPYLSQQLGANETIVLSSFDLTPYGAGPIGIAISAEQPGAYTLTVTCN